MPELTKRVSCYRRIYGLTLYVEKPRVTKNNEYSKNSLTNKTSLLFYCLLNCFYLIM